MPRLLDEPARVEAAGTPPKRILEFVGRASTRHENVSVAHMSSPPGWEEPAQVPEFEEVTLVLSGRMRVEHDGGVIEVAPGQAVLASPGERVRYSTPEGAEYVAVCLPAFSPETVHREE